MICYDYEPNGDGTVVIVFESADQCGRALARWMDEMRDARRLGNYTMPLMRWGFFGSEFQRSSLEDRMLIIQSNCCDGECVQEWIVNFDDGVAERPNRGSRVAS